MKALLLLLLVGPLAFAQARTDTLTKKWSGPSAVTVREVSIGIDVLKNIPPQLSRIYAKPNNSVNTNSQHFTPGWFFTFEPVLRIETGEPVGNVAPIGGWPRRTFWHIEAGYTGFGNVLTQRNIRLDQHGGFLKVGQERRHQNGSATLLLVLTSWQESGRYVLPGTTFGPFEGTIPSASRFTVGAECQAAAWFAVSDRSSLRLVFRLNALLPYARPSEFSTPYVPGVGFVAGERFNVGGGMTLQYDFRLKPRYVARP